MWSFEGEIRRITCGAQPSPPVDAHGSILLLHLGEFRHPGPCGPQGLGVHVLGDGACDPSHQARTNCLRTQLIMRQRGYDLASSLSPSLTRRSCSIDTSPGAAPLGSPRKDIGRSESLRSVCRPHRIFRPSDLIHGEVLGKGCFGQAIKVRGMRHWTQDTVWGALCEQPQKDPELGAENTIGVVQGCPEEWVIGSAPVSSFPAEGAALPPLVVPTVQQTQDGHCSHSRVEPPVEPGCPPLCSPFRACTEPIFLTRRRCTVPGLARRLIGSIRAPSVSCTHR